LSDPRHHIVVAHEESEIVGFASGVHYLHPDKPPELWINEVGVAGTHRRGGLGRALVDALLEHGRTLGCVTAWVLTEQGNLPAQALYRSAGGRQAEPAVLFEMDLTGAPGR
jgi:ribosomal protein S18 acetylase RimI-like enzyme